MVGTEYYSLPYNFSRYEGKQPVYNYLKFASKYIWLYDARLPYKTNLKLFLEDLVTDQTGVLIDGCDESVGGYLHSLGFEKINIGKEAVLNTGFEHFSKTSLKELVKRGSKKGKFLEILFSEENKNKLNVFKTECTHGNEPQLKYLFNDTFMNSNRLFVLENDEGKWNGAILISNKEKDYTKTDLILRRRNAPIGIMESLIYSIYNLLKEENCKHWSLGAVPFTIYHNSLFTKEGIFNPIGRGLRFAYNYKGLYNFKNMFNPVWKDYYFCFKPKLNLNLLYQILKKTNLLKLVFYKAKNSFTQL